MQLQLLSILSTKPVSILQHFVTIAYPLCQNKKKKGNFECHAFKVQWSVDYFVIELDGKALYLLCSDTIALLKEYSNL